MKVNNINGTTDVTCSCGSWLNHWENFSRQKVPLYCPEKSCTRKPEVGAHVQKDSCSDRNWYILPLCNTHNRETGKSLNIADYIALVPANVGQTCGH